jgi:hypothetical protein
MANLLTWTRNHIRTPIQAWLLHCLLVFTTAGITEWLAPGRDQIRSRVSGTSELVLRPLSIWDGPWYLRIAEEGYVERLSAAFFPVYPLLIRFLSDVTGLSFRASGVLISNMAFLGALILLHRLVGQQYGFTVARRTTWLVALTPMGFFFSAVYTESLFLFLSLAAVVLAREGRWTLAAFALLLVSLTRSVGVFVIVPMLFSLIEQRGLDFRRLLKPSLQLGAGAAGPLIFAAHLQRLWDDPLLMSSVQSEWTRSFSWPWKTLWTSLDEVRVHFVVERAACTAQIRDGQYLACLDRVGIERNALSDDLGVIFTGGAILLLIVAARRLAVGDTIYASLLFIFPLFKPTAVDQLLSMPRYISVAWPLFVVLAMLLERRRLYIAVLVISAVLMCVFLGLHARSHFVA